MLCENAYRVVLSREMLSFVVNTIESQLLTFCVEQCCNKAHIWNVRENELARHEFTIAARWLHMRSQMLVHNCSTAFSLPASFVQ